MGFIHDYFVQHQYEAVMRGLALSSKQTDLALLPICTGVTPHKAKVHLQQASQVSLFHVDWPGRRKPSHAKETKPERELAPLDDLGAFGEAQIRLIKDLTGSADPFPSVRQAGRASRGPSLY